MAALFETLLKGDGQMQATDRVVSVKTSDVVPPGENHLSLVSRIAVEIESRGGKRTTRWFIWKDLSVGPLTRAFIEQGGYFVRELTFYRDILTVYEGLMDEMGLVREIPWPRCINIEPYSRIIIEDLQPLGFKMCSKYEGLNLDHCVLAMQALGFFHALGILAVERQLITLEDFSGVHLYDNDNLASQFRAALRKLIDADLAGREMRLLIPNVRDKLRVCLSQNEHRLNVLNHGDFQTNNLLFKYDQYSGKPDKIRFLDFQMARYHSPALDLVYFLAFCPQLNVRRKNVDYLIRSYHRSLTSNMDLLRVASAPPKLSDIHDSVSELGVLKLYLVLMVIPKLVVNDPNAEPFCLEEWLTRETEASRTHGPVEIPWFDLENQKFRAILEVTLKEAVKNGSLK